VDLEHRGDLVCEVVDERIGAVAVLLDIGHDDVGQRRDMLGLAGHAEVGPDEVDVERRPHCRADGGCHG